VSRAHGTKDTWKHIRCASSVYGRETKGRGQVDGSF